MDKRTIIFVVLMTATFYLVNHFVFPPKPAPEGVSAPIRLNPAGDQHHKARQVLVLRAKSVGHPRTQGGSS